MDVSEAEENEKAAKGFRSEYADDATSMPLVKRVKIHHKDLFPQGRIQKLIKQDLSIKKTTRDALHIFNQAAVLFVKYLARNAEKAKLSNGGRRRSTLSIDDILTAIRRGGLRFRFLNGCSYILDDEADFVFSGGDREKHTGDFPIREPPAQENIPEINGGGKRGISYIRDPDEYSTRNGQATIAAAASPMDFRASKEISTGEKTRNSSFSLHSRKRVKKGAPTFSHADISSYFRHKGSN